MEIRIDATESEKALLGAVFLRPECFFDIAAELEVRDFYSVKCRTIFEALHRLREEGEPLELAPILNDLRRHERLERAGGEDFIWDLAGQISTSAGLAYHIKQVKEASATRKYLSILEGGQEALKAGTQIGDVLREANEAITKLERLGLGGLDPFEPLSKTLARKFEADTSRPPGELLGYRLKTFRELAKAIDGVQPGFYIIAADTNAGKTSFLCNLSLDLLEANPDLTGILFTLDDSKDVILNRLLAIAGGIPINRVQRKPETDHHQRLLEEAYDRLSDLAEQERLFIRDMSEIPDIRAMETEIKRRMKRKLFVVIDALYNLDVGIEGDQRRENIERANILKYLSSNYQIPVICTGEIVKSKDRIASNKPPTIHDLMESGKFAYNANLVLMLYPENWADYDQEDKPKMFLKFEKNKLSHVRTKQEYIFERQTARFL